MRPIHPRSYEVLGEEGWINVLKLEAAHLSRKHRKEEAAEPEVATRGVIKLTPA